MIAPRPSWEHTPSYRSRERRSPPQLVSGIVLIAICWPLAWAGPAPYSEHTFFPIWLGYILTVDGLTFYRVGSSLLTRDRRRFVLLFVLSVPLWWLFEFANVFLENWRYVGADDYSTTAYMLLASLSFSTVMPAVLGTAELYRTFGFFASKRLWIRISPSRRGLLATSLLGLALFVGSLIVPQVLFPFVWIGLFLFFDSINRLTGAHSIAEQVARCRWDTVIVLFAAGLTCGFFWEMWNSRSLPKWIYDVPGVSEPKVFEMPLLGYGGYLPFALEIYAAYHLLHSLLFRCRDHYLRLTDPEVS